MRSRGDNAEEISQLEEGSNCLLQQKLGYKNQLLMHPVRGAYLRITLVDDKRPFTKSRTF